MDVEVEMAFHQNEVGIVVKHNEGKHLVLAAVQINEKMEVKVNVDVDKGLL